MTKEAQRIAIAEACGWINQGKAKGVPALNHRWFNPSINSWYGDDNLPDYLYDLNAMHEAEKVLNFQQRSEYVSRLSSMVSHGFDFCHATATQRAEAFLRTLGLWIEEDTKP